MYRRFTPSRFVPANAHVIEQAGGVVYTYSTNDKLCAVAYRGKCSKADWHYSFRSDDRRAEAVRSFFKSLEESAAFRQSVKPSAASRIRSRPERSFTTLGVMTRQTWTFMKW